MRFFLCLLIVTLGYTVSAQVFFSNKKYPTQSFSNPLSLPFALSGNFGECRPNHFHSGVDLRTNAKENKEVSAIGDGYVSRVKIDESGFGNAIYITHPNGYTSVYAHLNKFFPALEDYVRKKQYENKTWKIDLIFMPYHFSVRRGDFIAWSGNTGSSQGPHLHLEIRDTKTEAPLNPLLFFTEIFDDKKPVIKQLAVYNAQKSIYEQSPALYKIAKGRLARDTVKVNAPFAFLGINAEDFMPLAMGTVGIYEMRMYVDEEPFFAWQMNNISYDITKYLNAHADYKTKKTKGIWIQLCTKLPNDKLGIYKTFDERNGKIDLSDGQPKSVRIEVYDTRYNTTSVNFVLQGKGIINASVNDEMIAGQKNYFKDENISFTLNEDALYDNIYFKADIKNTANPYSHIYQVHYDYVPLHNNFDLYLTPKKEIPAELRGKIAVVKSTSAKALSRNGVSAKLINNKVVANVSEFGSYEIVIDQKAPSIVTKLKDSMNIAKNNALFFTIRDETTSVKSCVATVDGQWLRLVRKGNTYIYEMDEHFPLGTHQFVINATDENNNTSTKTFTLKR